MSEVKRPTFADLFLAKQEKKEQHDLKHDHDQKVDLDQPATIVTEIIEPTDHRSMIIEPTDHRSNRPMIPEIIEQKDHTSERSMIAQTVERGYFLPNWIQDKLLPTLEVNEQVVLLRIIRLTIGFHRQVTDSISFSRLAEKCNISIPSAQRAIKSLQAKQLIRVISDLSRSKLGGNKYELTKTFYSHTDHRSDVSMITQTNKKDLDLDLKNNKSSQAESETMRIYHELTGNPPTRSDLTTYRKNLSHLSKFEFEQLLKNTLEKAHSKPNSLAYFVKAYQNPIQVNPIQQQAIKTKIAAIVTRLRESFVGTQIKIGELEERTKAACAREGVIFDKEIFNEIASKR